MADVAQALVDDVAARVLVPLIAGGALQPVAPIGAKRALDLAATAPVAANDDLPRLRLHAARALAPIDALPDPGPGEWLVAFALNDLLQVTNPTLVGTLGRERPAQLLLMVESVLLGAGAPQNVGEALARHATFGRLLELRRIDTNVSWWVGSREYRGAEPPPRLLAWPGVRRVRKRMKNVALPDMAPVAMKWTTRWEAAAASLLAATPLTDIASMARVDPRFEWSGAALDLIGVTGGRRLALRALDRAGDLDAAIIAARNAAGRLADETARRAAHLFVDDIEQVSKARKAG